MSRGRGPTPAQLQVLATHAARLADRMALLPPDDANDRQARIARLRAAAAAARDRLSGMSGQSPA